MADPERLRKSTTYELEMDMHTPIASTEEIYRFANVNKENKQDLQVEVEENESLQSTIADKLINESQQLCSCALIQAPTLT